MRGASAARVWLPALAWSLLVRDAAVASGSRAGDDRVAGLVPSAGGSRAAAAPGEVAAEATEAAAAAVDRAAALFLPTPLVLPLGIEKAVRLDAAEEAPEKKTMMWVAPHDKTTSRHQAEYSRPVTPPPPGAAGQVETALRD